MAATQLQIYNDALLLCEERLLASVTEARKPRYLLDQVWNNGGVQHCLEEGLWTFATRSTAIQFDPNIQPGFGYQSAFKQPPDYIRTTAVSADPYFNDVLTNYADESGYWWASCQILYVKYVSNDADYGNNLTLWPQTFTQFVAAHFANRIVASLTHDKEIQAKVASTRESNLLSARGKDGMNEPPGFFTRGNLSRARRGSNFGRPGGSGGQGSYY